MTKSRFVSMIWAGESKRNLWALLGTAYSDLRDHHDNIPMDKFLALAVPLLPLVPADMYLAKMGWRLTTGPDGQPELSRNGTFSAERVAAEYPDHTALSAGDIVNHCYGLSLANRAHRRRKPTAREMAARERQRSRPGAGTGTGTGPPACGGTLTLAVAPQILVRERVREQKFSGHGHQLIFWPAESFDGRWRF